MAAQVNLGPVALDPTDVTRLLKWTANHFKSSENVWGFLPQAQTAEALARAAAFLCEDRLTSGIGKGGWGHSDRLYIADLYGEESALHARDSVMTTVSVAKALQAYYVLLRQFPERRTRADDEWRTLHNDLHAYLDERWDSTSGYGGTLAVDREMSWSIRPSCRHTAWLLDLWLDVPGYQNRIQKTVSCLLDAVSRLDWANEKVATPVAIHSALQTLLRSNEAIDAETKREIATCCTIAEDQIVAKYVHGLCGWTSGQVPQDGRQTYTWFVLAEMSHVWGTKSRLAALMEEALCASLMEPWQMKDQVGVSRVQAGPAHLGISALAATALARRPKRTLKERRELKKLGRYVVCELESADSSQMAAAYSWALAYFVRDVATALVAGRTNRSGAR